MKDSIILEGKIYISARRAAKIINYAQDYIGQLCRSGKLDCKMVGRSWFVTEESLLSHRENAIDNTQERVLKVIKNNDVAIKETIQATIEEKKVEASAVAVVASPVVTTLVAPIVSPIQSIGFKYEVENKSLLPELRKKVPAPFALPKNILKLSAPAPVVTKKIQPRSEVRVQVRPAAVLSVSHTSPLTTTLAVTLLAIGGFFFTLSIASFQNNKSLSYNEASVGSAASELISEIMKSLGLRSKSPTPLASLNRENVRNDSMNAASGTTTDVSGIGIFPATNPTADELAKAKIINSFSDEVMTPVFRQTSGNDFVYVLVPVKEKKE